MAANVSEFSSAFTNQPTISANSDVLGVLVTNSATPVTIGGPFTLAIGASGVVVAESALDAAISANVLLAASQTWTIGTGRTLTVSGNIDFSNALTLNGAGAVVLAGTNSNAGLLTLQRGTLLLDYSINNTLKVPGPFAFGTSAGGTGILSVLGNSTAATTETIASTTLNRGGYAISIAPGAGQNATLDLGSLTRNVGSSLAISLPANAALRASAPSVDTVLAVQRS
jgi:fibronectin-binding autotransporter adhesin